MLSPDIILLIMLSLQPAGRSPYSQTVVEPGSPPGCEDQTSLLCAEPSPNPEWDGQYTRPETEDEGRERYAMIAQTIHRVASQMTWKKHPRCQPASVARWSKAVAPKECQLAWRERPWQGSSDELSRYLITVAFKESGFRRDVHAGKGKASKGDLDKHGRGQSWGLCQRKLGASGHAKTRRGWRALDIVGLDEASTERNLVTAVDVLSRGYNVCRSPWGPETRGPVCVFGVYGGLWAMSKNPAIAQRAKTLGRVIELERRFIGEAKLQQGSSDGDSVSAAQ